jgi:hypothetical protein
MLTVREVADRYRVSVAFLTLALEKIGYRASGPDSALPSGVVARFESAYGEIIRAARPAPGPGSTAETDEPAPPPISRAAGESRPHVMRVAHESVTGARDLQGNRVKRLLDNPGRLHAIDAAGTQDGDPWLGEVKPGRVHFYGGPIGTGPRAACGFIVRAVLGDEFVPDYDPAYPFRSRQCPRCAELVADGKGFRKPPDPFGYDPYCSAYLRVQIDGQIKVKDCSQDRYHRGPHRAGDGSEWEVGVDDYVPSPAEVGSRVTRAS